MKKLLSLLLISFFLQTEAQTSSVSIVTPAAGDSTYKYCVGTAYTFSASPAVLYGYNWYTTPNSTIAGPIQQPHITFTATGTYTVYLNYTTSFSGSGGTTQTVVKIDSVGSCNTTGINKTEESTHINIYPNPAQNIFTLQTQNTQKQFVNIYDINGKLMLSQIINGTISIDASNFNAGVYTITITSNAGVTNKRLVIVK